MTDDTPLSDTDSSAPRARRVRAEELPAAAGSPDGPDTRDEAWMERALEEARRAAVEGEVPVGAVVVRDGQLVSAAHNLRESLDDPTAHAEILALRAAAEELGSWRLLGCTLYVTLEPCAMCAGALVNARVERLVFAAEDPKAGFCGSLGDIVRDPRLNHRLSLTAGVGSAESSRLLVDFFRRRRKPCR